MNSYPADLTRVLIRRLQREKLPTPDTQSLQQLIEIAFFTSLKSEEGQSLTFRICYVDPENTDPKAPPRIRYDRWEVFGLSEKIPLTVRALAKLSQAVDPWTTSLAVWADSPGQLYIWGFVDQTIHFNTFLVRESGGGAYQPPGLFQLVVDGTADLLLYRGFDLLARLSQNRILTVQHDILWSGPLHAKLEPGIRNFVSSVKKSVGKDVYDSFPFWNDALEDLWLATICRILIGIQRYRHGGALLISEPSDDLNYKYKLSYGRLAKALRHLGVHQARARDTWDRINDNYLKTSKKNMPIGLHLDSVIEEGDAGDAEAELTGCIRMISALSRVDGLVHLQPNFTLDGFGVEITQDKIPQEISLAGDSELRAKLRKFPYEHFGTRHRSMMRYCNAHPDAIGFVISQDGDIRAMTRHNESLVVWEDVMIRHFIQKRLLRPKKRKPKIKN